MPRSRRGTRPTSILAPAPSTRPAHSATADVLDRDHGIGVRQVHAGLEQAFLQEGIADLDRGPALGALLVQLERRE